VRINRRRGQPDIGPQREHGLCKSWRTALAATIEKTLDDTLGNENENVFLCSFQCFDDIGRAQETLTKSALPAANVCVSILGRLDERK
jgi:hypothetical protein